MKNRCVPRTVAVIVFIVFGPVASFMSTALGDEPFIQSDIYDALYQAYIECDEGFGQSRSEFITEKLEHDAGQITIATLKKILSHNVEVANQAITQRSTDREFFVSEIIGGHDESKGQPRDRAEEDNEPHKEVREIDAFLKEQRRYVEVHECVLEALWRPRSSARLSVRFWPFAAGQLLNC